MTFLTRPVEFPRQRRMYDDQRTGMGGATMVGMVDPTNAMLSFREAAYAGVIQPARGRIHNDCLVFFDMEHGFPRFSFARLIDDEITSVAIFAPAEPVEGRKCFQLGIATPEEYRRQGHARALVPMALDELKALLFKGGIKDFYVEAMIDVDNEASNRVALATLTKDREEGIDKPSGKPAYQYLIRFQEG